MKRRQFLQAGLWSPLLGKFRGSASASPAPGQAPASGPLLRLESRYLSLALSPRDGSLVEVENKLTGEVHQASGTTFVIYSDHGEVIPGTSRLVKQERTAEQIELVFEHSPVMVRVKYHLGRDRHFLEKTLAVENQGPGAVLIQEVITDRLRFTPQFLEAYAHDDGTDWKCPINVFLRTEKGGLFLGIENPYFEMLAPGAWNASRVELRYSPRWILRPGETFESEPSFLGVYKKEGIYFFKELQQFAYMTQKQIVLDWGEVWAMQDFLRAVQPFYEMPYPGYYLRANCVDFFSNLGTPDPADPTPFGRPPKYWQEHSHARFEATMVPAGKYFVDRVAEQGHVRSIDWGTIWLGHTGWLRESPEQYLENLDESWNIEPNPYWKELVDYAAGKGLGVGIMDEGGARDYLKKETRWKILSKEGAPVPGVVQLEGRMGRNCWANPAFARWWVEIVSKTIEKYRVPIWGTDAGMIWWVPFDPPLECHARDHGHPVGECGYYAWRNIMWASAELRRRHPRCALRNAGGMHRGYPWVLRDWIEYHGYLDPIPMGKGGSVTDNIRFQSWHAQNLRFIPQYKSAGGTRTDDRYGMAYGLFSHVTRGDKGMASLAPPRRVTDPEERRKHLTFFRKWAAWADRNVRYLRVRRDMLGEPRATGLDGCAHCARDGGFLFLFNPSTGTRAARIPLNHWIGLTEGDRFAVNEIFPADGLSYGVYQRGEEIVAAVASHNVLALEISPARGDERGERPQVPAGIPVDKAFLNGREVRERLGVAVRIPGEKA